MNGWHITILLVCVLAVIGLLWLFMRGADDPDEDQWDSVECKETVCHKLPTK